MTTPQAIIQRIDEQTLTVLINGEVQEIKHQLEDLKNLLSSQQAKTIQYADKIYNIEQIDQANFGFVTGKKAFNEYLTKALILAMQEDSLPAKRFYNLVSRVPNWEQQIRYSNKAKEIIAYSFVGVIGIQLSMLMAIGKESISETKQQKYLQKCLHIVGYSLDLVNYVLLSRLWDQQQQNADKRLQVMPEIVASRLEQAFPPSLSEQFELFKSLYQIFSTQHWPFPIAELENWDSALQANSPLISIIQ
ncbi:MAG: hypothetical protein AAF705_13430, partial [Bacteroidota bacterium]